MMLVVGGFMMVLLSSWNTEAFHLVVPQSYLSRGRNTILHMVRIKKSEKKKEEKQKFDLLKLIDDDEDEEDDLKKAQKEPLDAGNWIDTSATLDGNADPDRPDLAAEMAKRMESRPDISTYAIDDFTGLPTIRQGRFVMDLIKRAPIYLHPEPELRLAQMFPGCPPDVREKYRMDWATCEVPDMIQKLRAVCEVDGKIPVQPSVANKAIDFVLANREYLGLRMRTTISRLSMKCASAGELEEMKMYKELGTNFRIIDDYIAAPFRQLIMNAEVKVGPNFGNMEIGSYSGTELYERAATYIVLKGMQCHWEKRLRDAEEISTLLRTPKNKFLYSKLGDPRRYAEDEAIYTVEDCARVCTVAVEMVKTFVTTSELYDDLPVELRFFEDALTIKGGVALRKYMTDEFCPKEQITPEALREGMGRLVELLHQMYPDPYFNIYYVADKLNRAIQKGTVDERDPYKVYSNSTKGSPGFFQTYTFNCIPGSLMFSMAADRFDLPKENFPKEKTLQEVVEEIKDDPRVGFRKYWRQFQQEWGMSDISANVFGRGAIKLMEPDLATYYPPEALSRGRPHNLTWWYDLNPVNEENPVIMGDIGPGEIIYE